MASQRLARETMLQALGADHIHDAWKHQPATLEQLDLFLRDPLHNGPTIPGAQLDTSASTLQGMIDSAWNKKLTQLLTEEAENMVAISPDLEQFGMSHSTHWAPLFSAHINNVLHDVYNTRPFLTESPNIAEARMHQNYADKKKRNRVKSLLQQVSSQFIFFRAGP